ncbi:hypothetical protein JXA34_03010 [Patescibacteria group bacterium]|nr:hypothetical protein [Patescibacteria group bacterium]
MNKKFLPFVIIASVLCVILLAVYFVTKGVNVRRPVLKDSGSSDIPADTKSDLIDKDQSGDLSSDPSKSAFSDYISYTARDGSGNQLSGEDIDKCVSDYKPGEMPEVGYARVGDRLHSFIESVNVDNGSLVLKNGEEVFVADLLVYLVQTTESLETNVYTLKLEEESPAFLNYINSGDFATFVLDSDGYVRMDVYCDER